MTMIEEEEKKAYKEWGKTKLQEEETTHPVFSHACQDETTTERNPTKLTILDDRNKSDDWFTCVDGKAARVAVDVSVHGHFSLFCFVYCVCIRNYWLVVGWFWFLSCFQFVYISVGMDGKWMDVGCFCCTQSIILWSLKTDTKSSTVVWQARKFDRCRRRRRRRRCLVVVVSSSTNSLFVVLPRRAMPLSFSLASSTSTVLVLAMMINDPYPPYLLSQFLFCGPRHTPFTKEIKEERESSNNRKVRK